MSDSKSSYSEGVTPPVMWRLYDSDKKMFFNNLSLGQVQKVLESIGPDEMKFWLICQDNEANWYPLSQKIKELKEGKDNRPKGVLSLEGFRDSFMDTKSGLTKTRTNKSDKRKSRRHNQKIGAFIDVGDDILSGTTRDISMISIKFEEKFPIKYRGRFYPITLKTKPSITLRCTPRITEKEHVRATWNIANLDPNFNLTALAEFLGEEIINIKK